MPPQGRSSRRASNRAALLAAAADALLEVGYDAANLTDIARRAGVTTGAIYSIFGSKLGLVAALLEGQLQMAEQQLDEVTGGQPAAAAVARSHAEVLERLLVSEEGRRAVKLEVELAGLAVREPALAALVAAGRRARLERLSQVLGAPLATALLALEQGWSLAVALGEALPSGALPAAAEALATELRPISAEATAGHGSDT